MSLVRDVLKKVADEGSIVSSQPIVPTPLRLLMQQYTRFTLNDDSLTQFTEETTGKQLKDAVRALPGEQQVQLLHIYITAARAVEEGRPVTLPALPEMTPTTINQVVQADKKQALELLQLYAPKMLLWGSASLFLMLLGAGIMNAIITGGIKWNVLSTPFFNLAIDISRLIVKGP